MDFVMVSRATSATSAAASAADDPELNERHWAYMDAFADRMTARGPTLGADRQTWTGSLHIVDLPGPDAARAFVADEPYERAGRFAGHRLWRFDNLLGRPMWHYAGTTDEPYFLVFAPSTPAVAIGGLPAALRDRLVVYGRLRSVDSADDSSDDGVDGTLLVVQAPDRASLDALLADIADIEAHDWEFGRRR